MKELYRALVVVAALLVAGCDTPWAAAKRQKEGVSWDQWKSGIRTKEELAESKKRQDAEVERENQEIKADAEQNLKKREAFLVRGLSVSDAKLVWGSPSHVNETTGAFGRHEQWVYYGVAVGPVDGVTYYANERGWIPGKSFYLYFENGKLSSWQASR